MVRLSTAGVIGDVVEPDREFICATDSYSPEGSLIGGPLGQSLK
jgi:hypothetical protein